MTAWLYVAASIAGAELLYAYLRWEHGTPEARREVTALLWQYATAWVGAISLYALHRASSAVTAELASWLGVPVTEPSTGRVLDWLGAVSQQWMAFWAAIAVLRAVGSVEVAGFRLGIPTAVAGYLERATSWWWGGVGWFIADLAILYVLTLLHRFMVDYGVWAMGTALMIPRSTRSLGAGLASTFVVLTIGLPILMGVAHLELQYALIAPLPLPCNPGLSPRDLLACSLDLAAVSWEAVTKPFIAGPYNAFWLYVYDAALDMGYMLTALLTYYIAELIDSRAARLLEWLP